MCKLALWPSNFLAGLPASCATVSLWRVGLLSTDFERPPYHPTQRASQKQSTAMLLTRSRRKCNVTGAAAVGPGPPPLRQVPGLVDRGCQVGARHDRRSRCLPAAVRAQHEGGPGFSRGGFERIADDTRLVLILVRLTAHPFEREGFRRRVQIVGLASLVRFCCDAPWVGCWATELRLTR